MGNSLEELLHVMRGSRTWRELSQDCGGSPTHTRLQDMATRGIRAFPGPDTINALAQGLALNPRHIVQAAAVSLGVWDTGKPAKGRDLVLPRYAETLTDDQMRTIHAIIREYARANAKHTHQMNDTQEPTE